MQHPRIYSSDRRLVAEVGNAERELADLHRHEADAQLIVVAVNAHDTFVSALRRIINMDRQRRGITSEDAYEFDGPFGEVAREALFKAFGRPEVR